jgi:hypothetical protein
VKDLGIDRGILKWIMEKYVMRLWIGFIWRRVRFMGGLLCTFGSHKMRGIT